MRPMFHSLVASGHICPRAADHDCDDDDDGADGDDGDDYVRMYDDGNADDDNGCCEAKITRPHSPKG